MCGIIGYVGFREAWPLIQEGLQRLEYRGYDSAGVVTLGSDKKPEFHQAVGRVKDLVSSLNGRSPRGTLGLGTYSLGYPRRSILANTHPHTGCDGRVALVHNGIVENFLELKDSLILKGHTFTSETDSEVLAHLNRGGVERRAGLRHRLLPNGRPDPGVQRGGGYLAGRAA